MDKGATYQYRSFVSSLRYIKVFYTFHTFMLLCPIMNFYVLYIAFVKDTFFESHKNVIRLPSGPYFPVSAITCGLAGGWTVVPMPSNGSVWY